MCLVYNISAIWNPSADVFEQFAATDVARTITHDHLRSPTITQRSLKRASATNRAYQSTILIRFQHFDVENIH